MVLVVEGSPLLLYSNAIYEESRSVTHLLTLNLLSIHSVLFRAGEGRAVEGLVELLQ